MACSSWAKEGRAVASARVQASMMPRYRAGMSAELGGQPAVCDHVVHDLILVQMCEWLRPVVELPHGGPEGVHICSLAHRLLGLEDFRSHVPQCPAQAQLLQQLSCLGISLPGQAKVCQLGLARPCSGVAVHTAVQQDVICLQAAGQSSSDGCAGVKFAGLQSVDMVS